MGVTTAAAALVGLLLANAPSPAAVATPAPQASAPVISELTLKSLAFRQIGPANTAGRVTDIAVDPKNTDVIYAAEATGGLYKSDNGGVTWSNAFSKEDVASVGAVAVAPSKPEDVWVGTGEANSRNSVSWGDGVYVSHDGGSTWKRTGLEKSYAIGRIVVDAKNPDVVWVAATGNLFGPGGERGVYKTTDGGKSWTPSLTTDANTGAIDLAVDPGDSNVAFAAMWARRRNAYSLTQGSASDGLYRTLDGGKTWERLTNGLPTDDQRIGVAIAPKNHKIVYAVIASSQYGGQDINESESAAGGVFRSDDMGNTWKRMSGYDPRSFYFSQMRVDPSDSNRVYELNFDLGVSRDGGKTFKDTSTDDVHSDWHALWIDPRNGRHMIAGTDGGIYFSSDRGGSWRQVQNMATGEFYTVSYDFAHPYDVCGGLQDNNTWCGPHSTNDEQGITNSDWIAVFGGDGFYAQVDPRKPWLVWAEAQGGFAGLLDLRTGATRFIRPESAEGLPALRFNWNTPLAIDRFNPDVLYMGGNEVFRITDQGRHVQAISPDLSKHQAGTTETAGSAAENHATVVALSQSPLDRDVLWAGTDDGNVQITRNGGASWTNVTNNLPLDVRSEWISSIDTSHFSAGRAYLAVNGHYDDDFRPHAFVTEDYGQTWKSIAAGLPDNDPVKVVREDPFNENLLYAGTEFALYVSPDRGARWIHLTNGLPTVAIDDIQVHPRDHDLLLATHGAAIWVLDDVEGLEGLTPQALDAPATLFDMRPAYEVRRKHTQDPSDDQFHADNAPDGVVINYYIKSFTGEPVDISIKDSGKRLVRKLQGVDYPGLNRVVWDMHPAPDAIAVSSREQPPFAPPGEYTVTLTIGKTTVSKTVRVGRYDPAWAADRLR